MVSEPELLAAVDAAFATAGAAFAPWPDPHPDRQPLDEEYSRVTDPARWRILGARADAWLAALADYGLARVERDVEVHWAGAPGTTVTRTDRAVPLAAGALPLVVGRSEIEGVPDAGVTLGAGDPVVVVSVHPDCGCDACDSGSQNDLDHLDHMVRSVVLGRFRRLQQGDREVTAFLDGWSANFAGRPDVAAVLADPRGWEERSGPSWLADLPPSS